MTLDENGEPDWMGKQRTPLGAEYKLREVLLRGSPADRVRAGAEIGGKLYFNRQEELRADLRRGK